MEEKEKKPWMPPETACAPDSVEYFMQNYKKWMPPGQTLYKKERQIPIDGVRCPIFDESQWRRGLYMDDISVASNTDPHTHECKNATIRLSRDQVIASCTIPGETTFGDIFKQLGVKEDNMARSLADKKFKKVTIECEDGTTYAGEINHVSGNPYRYKSLCVEAMIVDKPIGAYGIEKVLFQNPATIVYWADGTKTVVNCMDNVEIKKKIVDGKEVTIRKPKKADTYSKENGLAMAIVKKWAGNNGNYNNIFREFIPEMAQAEKEAKKAAKKTKKA